MAKVRGPLFSLEAFGKFADAMVFFTWKGIQVVRKYVVPSNPRTAAQVSQRNRFSHAVSLWHALDSLRKLAWDVAASGLKMSGFNYFVQQVLKQGVDDPDIPRGDNSAPDVPTNVHAVGISGGVRLTWDPSTASDLWGYVIFGSDSSGFDADAEHKIGETTDTAYVDYISDGTTHYYRIRAMDKSGNLSGPTAEVSGTPT